MSRDPWSYICDNLPDPRQSHHSHAIIAGNLIFLSGAIPRRTDSGLHVGVRLDPSGELVHDVKAQFKSAMDEVLEVLDGLGASQRSIVEICAYLRDVHRDFGAFNDAYGDFFRDWLPARTTVEVSGLPSNVCIELKVTAVRT